MTQLTQHPLRDVVAECARNAAPAAAEPPLGPTSYGHRKAYVVAEDLGEMCGPTAGTVTLPPHLDWSGRATYDLDKPARLASMYRTVLNEAASAHDLISWIDGRVLTQIWSTLWLPLPLRRLWEGRFPELSGSASAHA